MVLLHRRTSGADASFVNPDDGLPATEAQWMEHSADWRYAHLDRAPSAHFRQSALQEHERQESALQARQPAGAHRPQVWTRLKRRAAR